MSFNVIMEFGKLSITNLKKIKIEEWDHALNATMFSTRPYFSI
jgi:hypothetical protein